MPENQTPDPFDQDKIEGIISGWKEDEPRRLEPEPSRQTTRHPHEQKRSARFVGVTLPSPAWKDYITAKSEEYGLGPSDLVVYCLSDSFRRLESGELPPPDGSKKQRHHRAGEGLDLSWTPS